MLDWPACYERLAREVVEKEVSVVPSLNHTGTWFLIDFLLGHPAVEGRLELPDALARNGLVQSSVLHFHVGGAPDLWEAYSALIATGRAIVPLRDPMRSLCTRQARHPFLDHRYIVEGFVRVANDHDRVTFFPVDCDPIIRADVLRRTLSAMDLDAADDYVEFWARTWKPRNSIGHETAPIQWYGDGAWEPLRAVLKEEIELLLDSRDVLVPFLKEQGYKELPWWTL